MYASKLRFNVVKLNIFDFLHVTNSSLLPDLNITRIIKLCINMLTACLMTAVINPLAFVVS